jgi:hypothetical protein
VRELLAEGQQRIDAVGSTLAALVGGGQHKEQDYPAELVIDERSLDGRTCPA